MRTTDQNKETHRLICPKCGGKTKLKIREDSTIVLDSMLSHELTPEEYEAAWGHLLETGHLCIVRNDLYVSDHILMEDGTDLGQTYSVPVYDDMAVRSGNVFIDAPELPEVAQGLDSVYYDYIGSSDDNTSIVYASIEHPEKGGSVSE